MPYLLDDKMTWTKHFNVSKIPEVMILTLNGSEIEVIFRGAMDNNPQAETSVTEKFLEKALDQVLKGEKPIPSQIRPMGCNIRVF
jgi:ubiquitin C-terminal hydrolase